MPDVAGVTTLSMAILDAIRQRMPPGLSEAELLRRAKLGPTFLRDHRRRGTQPSVGSLRKIAEVLGCDVHDLLTSAETTLVQREVAVIGAVEADVWRATVHWPESKWVSYAIVKNPALEGVRLYALEWQDSDNLFPPGTKLVCADFADLPSRGPRPGDLVIVHRFRNDLVEVTCRRYVVGTAGPELEDGRGRRISALEEGITIAALVVQDFREHAL